MEMKNTKISKLFWKLFAILAALGLLLGLFVIGTDFYVRKTTESMIVTDQLPEGEFDCIFVLGCGIRADGSPTHMLRDRLDVALMLYDAGVSDYILVSGDNSKTDYDEVGVMKGYLVENGVPEEVIYMDHAGFSTYESAYRAKAIFGIEKMVIVTQEYHLYRALYDAKDRGIEAVGVAAEANLYSGQTYREIREILARTKDFLYCVFDPAPTYLGEMIPLGKK